MGLSQLLPSVAFATLLATQSHAGLITYAGYEHDTSTDIVTGDSLEWLRWDVTVNQSIGTALGTFAGSGWRLASNLEMSRLMNSFAFGAMVFDADENTRQVAQFAFGDTTSEDEVTNIFISMFGDTYKASGLPLIGTVDEPYEQSAAFYGEDGDGDELYNFASVSDDYTVGTGSGPIVNFSFAIMADDVANDAVTEPFFGVALVRSTVPSPSTLMLAALGLTAMVATRRRRPAHLL